MARPKIRGCRPGARPAFSLLELVLVLLLSVVILAIYIRAMDEAETMEYEIRTDSLPRLARSGGPRPVDPLAAVSEASTEVQAEGEPGDEGAELSAPQAGIADEITRTATSDQ